MGAYLLDINKAVKPSELDLLDHSSSSEDSESCVSESLASDGNLITDPW